MADKVAEAYVEISAKIDKLNASLDQVRAKVEKTAKDAEQKFAKAKISFNTTGLLAGLSAATLAMKAFQFAKDSIADWSKQETASKRLGQALKNAGVAAKDLATAQEDMEGFSSSLQKVTAYGDETVTEVQAMLVAMTGMTGRAVRPLTEAVLDLASGLNMDAISAAKLVAKTAEGADALGRLGINTKGARTESERLDAIIKGVGSKFGNYARNELTTFDGKMKHLSNSIGEVKESFGDLLTKAINPLFPQLEKLSTLLLGFAIKVKQEWFKTLAAGLAQVVMLYEFARKIPLLGKMGVLDDDALGRMKLQVLEWAKIAADAKAELDNLMNPGQATESTYQGKGPRRTGVLTEEEKKSIAERAQAALDATRNLQAAQARLMEQGIKDEFDRKSMAAMNEYEDARRRLLDKATMEKMEQRTLNDELLALYFDYMTKLQEIDEDRNKDEEKRRKEKLKAEQEMNEQYAAIARDVGSIIDSEWSSALHNWISEGQSFTQATAHMWTNMANRIIEDIIRISTEWLLLQGLLAAFPFLRPFVGAFAGSIGAAGPVTPVVGSGGPHGPVSVGRSGAVSMQGVERRLDALNMNLAMAESGGRNLDINVRGSLEGQDIYLADRKASRVYERIR